MDNLEPIIVALHDNREAARHGLALISQTPDLPQEIRVGRMSAIWVRAMQRHYDLLERCLELRSIAGGGEPLRPEWLRAPARPPDVPESTFHRRSPARQRAR